MSLPILVETDRRGMITGTDIAAIMGMSPWLSPSDVWMAKKFPELLTPPDKEKMSRFRLGHRHEQTLKLEYEDRHGVQLEKPELIVQPAIPWMAGSPDFFWAPDRKRGVEMKSSEGWSRHEWGNDGTQIIPWHYRLQVEWYMILTYKPDWDVIALLGAHDIREYTIFADPELQNRMKLAALEFYKRFIVGTERPEFDCGEHVREYIKRKWPKATKDKKAEIDYYGDADVKKSLKLLRKSRRDKKASEEDIELAKTIIMSFMKDADLLEYDGGDDGPIRITYKSNRDTQKVEWRDLAREALDLLSQEDRQRLLTKHTSDVTGSRVMRIYDGTEKE